MLLTVFNQVDVDVSDKIKRDFFQAVAVSILLYRGTTWTLTKSVEKKRDWNYTRMLRAGLKNAGSSILQNKSFMASNLRSQKPFQTNKTCEALLEKLGSYLMYSCTCTCQCSPASKYLFKSFMCWHRMQPRKTARFYGWPGWNAWESVRELRAVSAICWCRYK